MHLNLCQTLLYSVADGRCRFFCVQAEEALRKYDEGTLELRPGCDLLQSLEEILNGILGKLREAAGQEAMKALNWSNTPRIMAECGSKGSPLNISQMMACVGQQAVGGKYVFTVTLNARYEVSQH